MTIVSPPPLSPRSWKGKFPFPLGTTSFIFPEDYAGNVARLAPCLDAIELLFFEATPRGLPDMATIGALAELADRWPITYNVHLPLDLALGSQDREQRAQAVETTARILALTTPLSPTTWTLHLNPHRDRMDAGEIRAWQERIGGSIARLLDRGANPVRISAENILYPFDWAEPVIARFGLSICMDIGHLLRQQENPLAFFDRHAASISIVHLHGVHGQRDHQSLETLPPDGAAIVATLLRVLHCEVSLEVFSHPHLLASLAFMDRWRQGEENLDRPKGHTL